VAILAGTLGIPMLVAAGPGLLAIPPGTSIILDADEGVLHPAPDARELSAMRARLEQRREQRERDVAAAQSDCRLASGERIEVFANLTGTAADATLAVSEGAEGCGLLRTEFLFLERTTAPDEEEQRCYQLVAQILGARPLVIRTRYRRRQTDPYSARHPRWLARRPVCGARTCSPRNCARASRCSLGLRILPADDHGPDGPQSAHARRTAQLARTPPTAARRHGNLRRGGVIRRART
jgi:phosphocarrier protein FPr/phosphocarrier protein